jgi:hypothetical protein
MVRTPREVLDHPLAPAAFQTGTFWRVGHGERPGGFGGKQPRVAYREQRTAAFVDQHGTARFEIGGLSWGQEERIAREHTLGCQDSEASLAGHDVGLKVVQRNCMHPTPSSSSRMPPM